MTGSYETERVHSRNHPNVHVWRIFSGIVQFLLEKNLLISLWGGAEHLSVCLLTWARKMAWGSYSYVNFHWMATKLFLVVLWLIPWVSNFSGTHFLANAEWLNIKINMSGGWSPVTVLQWGLSMQEWIWTLRVWIITTIIFRIGVVTF